MLLVCLVLLFLSTARSSLTVNGFRSCGIWPFNQDIFTDEDFLTSVTTEEEQPLVEDPNEFSGAEETLDIEYQDSCCTSRF